MSYEALRNYHYDREPPPSYLARVAEVFDVRLAWLVADKGEMTEEEEAASHDTEEKAALGGFGLKLLPWITHCSPVVRAALVDHLSERRAARWRQGEGELSPEEREKEAKRIWDRILEPLDAPPVDWPAFKEYVLAAIHALNLALRIQTTEED